LEVLLPYWDISFVHLNKEHIHLENEAIAVSLLQQLQEIQQQWQQQQQQQHCQVGRERNLLLLQRANLCLV